MSTGERGRLVELDGVRGVAILLVLIGHGADSYGLGALAPAGVTLFFALSGYLITQLLVAERERRGRVDLRGFYMRRMTRLAPPLYVMLLVTAPLLAVPWQVVLPAATWTGNYFDVTGFGYGHTWSLAVEEQFYLLWPFVLAALAPRRRSVQLMAGLVAVLMLWRMVVLADGQLEHAYASLETAGSAIAAGALVAFARWRLPRVWAVLGLVGMVAVPLWLILTLGAFGAWFITPLLVTPMAACVVAAADGCRWLRCPVLTACGVASYSLYLWHEPVSYFLGGTLTPLGVVVGAGVGVVAYLGVERPVMRWRARGVRRSAFRVDGPGAVDHPCPPAAESVVNSGAGSAYRPTTRGR